LSVKEQHTISDISISVDRHGLGYQRTYRLFHQKHPDAKTMTGNTVAPLWSAKYIPNKDLVLPSGRLFLSASGKLMFVSFDGVECTLHILDSNKSQLVSVESASDYRNDLKDLYMTSFSPDDVYWDYALVKCAAFFGSQQEDKLDFSKEFVDTEYLYKLW